MLEDLLILERDAFLFFNGSESPFMDRFMWLYSGKQVWLPLAFFILFLLIYKKNWREVILVVAGIALVIAMCDQFASHLCKPVFTRFRPTHHPDFMEHVKTVFNYRGGQYGFISSHAANAFGFATFLSLLLRNKLVTVTLFIWAILMAYSRIYLGVHFISDIIPGAIAGTVFGYIVYRIYTFSRNWILNRRQSEYGMQACSLYALNTKRLIAGGVLFTILLILFFNGPIIHFLR
ncbi:MAG: phosphatase PAP2 family protein [Tannerellaceae bacterium]|nr:phosphatase PAP2 family protein [Tannerellaceae bacterium]